MPVYDYGLSLHVRDLGDVMSTIIQSDPRFISFFPISSRAAVQRKHEWLEDQITPRSATATAVSGADITASEADVAKLKAGSLFYVKDNTALFKVSSITDTTHFKYALVAANGSSTTTVSATNVLQIAGTPMPEATSNGDGEEGYRGVDTAYNITQIFRKEVVISGTALSTVTYGNVENSVDIQTEFKMMEMLRDMNRLALYGNRSADPSATVNGTFGGLYQFGTGTGALTVDASSATFDSFVVNDGAQAVVGEGGMPSMIMCSPGQARVLANEYKDKLQIIREDRARGAYVAVVVNEMNGTTMTIVADPDMPDTEAWVIDNGGFSMVPLKGRNFYDEDTTPKGFDGIKRTILGEVTLTFKNCKQRCCRIHSLKDSATALAAIKAAS